MKKIFITGANGQLGRAVNARYANHKEIELINTDVAELDITNVEAVLNMIREVQPYAIINCAAHTAVDACETDEDNAYRINAIGARNLSIAAGQTGAKMMHIPELSPAKKRVIAEIEKMSEAELDAVKVFINSLSEYKKAFNASDKISSHNSEK